MEENYAISAPKTPCIPLEVEGGQKRIPAGDNMQCSKMERLCVSCVGSCLRLADAAHTNMQPRLQGVGLLLALTNVVHSKMHLAHQGIHSSLRGTGVTKMPVVGFSSRGQDTSSGTCPGLSLKVNLHATAGVSTISQQGQGSSGPQVMNTQIEGCILC